MFYHRLEITVVRTFSGDHVKTGDAQVLSLGDLSTEDSQLFWKSVSGNENSSAIDKDEIFTRVNGICRGSITCMLLFQRLSGKDSSMGIAEEKLLDLPIFSGYLSIMNDALLESDADISKDNSKFMQMKILDLILNSEGYLLPKQLLSRSPKLLHTAEELVKNNLLSVYMAPPLGQNSRSSYPSFTFPSPVVGYFVKTQKYIILKQEMKLHVQERKRLEQELKLQMESKINLIKKRLSIHGSEDS